MSCAFRVSCASQEGGTRIRVSCAWQAPDSLNERDFFLDNLLVRTHIIIERIWRTGLTSWVFGGPGKDLADRPHVMGEFPFAGSLVSIYLPTDSLKRATIHLTPMFQVQTYNLKSGLW